MYHCFFRHHVCLSNLKHAPSRELPLTARKTVFSHLKDMVLFELASYQLATAALKYPYISISSYNTKTIEVTQFSQFKTVRSITKMQLF